MENFTYCTPTKYIFGSDAEMHAADELKALGLKNVLVCYGGGAVVRSGLLERVTNHLSAAGICYQTLGGIEPNPTDPLVRKGIEQCRAVCRCCF